MKKYFFVMILLTNTSLLFAQNSDPAVKPEIKIVETSLISEEKAADRSFAFDNRRSDEGIKKTADELAFLLDFENPDLKTASGLYEAGDYKAFLDEFKRFYMKKVMTFNDYYFNSGFNYPSVVKAVSENRVDPQADLMMFDVITMNNQQVNLGKPGTINWDYGMPSRTFGVDYMYQNPPMWSYSLFNPLLYAYFATKEGSYLQKWCDYMDDYSMNQNVFQGILPAYIPDSHHGDSVIRMFIATTRHLAKLLDENGDVLPSDSFARLFTKLMTEYPAYTLTYSRSNPQNWTNGMYNDQIALGLLLRHLGFKNGDDLLRAGMRRLEDFQTVSKLPDGSIIEQVIGYDIESLKGLYNIVKTLKNTEPDIVSPWWYDEMAMHMKDIANFLIGMVTPQGGFPMGNRSDLRSRTNYLEDFEKWGKDTDVHLATDNIRAIVETVRRVNGAKTPQYTSESFPYSGYYHFREAWAPGSQNAYLYGHNHGAMSNMSQGMFVLAAFGQDLMMAGEVGMYDAVKDFVLVDGKPQVQNATIPRWGHRFFMVSAWDEPVEGRWSTTSLFDYGEIMHDSYFGDGPKVSEEVGIWGDRQSDQHPDSLVRALKTAMGGIVHKRGVHFIREHGFWIVTDRFTSNDTHKYSARWKFPLLPAREGYKSFEEENIIIDKASQSIKTQREGMANISIYNFSSLPAEYETSIYRVNRSNSYRISDFYFTDASIQGTGEQVLLSVFYPRRTQDDEVKSIRSIGESTKTVGFEATLADGTVINYLVATDKNQPLSTGGASMTGESLLVVKGKETNGIALGGKNTPLTDFEFTLTGGSFSDVVPIYTPVKPVRILPDAPSFADKAEITMICATGDVEIRYTTDGSRPTPSSALYTGPVTLTETTRILARAFRKGEKENPVSADGVKASEVTLAVFTTENIRPAKVVDAANLESGLKYDYYQGYWKKEFFNLDRCIPVSNGTVGSLFEMPEDPKNVTYSYRYSGYINIPSDGVYCFHAPEEYVKHHIMESYELNVFINGQQWYPSTRKHAFGVWSIPLAKGMHEIVVTFTDARVNTPAEYNRPGTGLQNRIWDGKYPEVMISWQGMEKQFIPASMLFRDK